MNYLLISYGDENFDGRLRELKKVFDSLGRLSTFSIMSCKNRSKGTLKYLFFLVESISFLKSKVDTEILVLDNRKAILPGIYAIKRLNPKIVILDCRELYVLREVHSLQSKIGCLLEKYFIPKVDIVISANTERANIMSQEYTLKRKPLVFENIRKLEYSEKFDIAIAKEKYKEFLDGDYYNIISSAGCNLTQSTDVLVRNIIKVDKKVRLLLVGNCERKDEEVIRKIIADNDLANVYIIGKVVQDELKYLLSISNIGIVSYSQEGLNNQYCASGKVYEYINEGLPIITTSNPPLKNLCETESIGVSDDCFADGINKVLSNYDYYKERAISFAKKKTVENNNESLARNIKNIIKEW